MKALVVYESIFGNTKQVAEAIAEGLRELCEINLFEVSSAPLESAGYDLIVAGGPTQAWGMSRSSTRKGAREQAAQIAKTPVSSGIGIREWLGSLPKSKGTAAAAFDTAIRKKGRFPYGSAAKGVASSLEKKGFRMVAKPEQFFVKDTPGPLEEDELERARHWGANLTSKISS